MPHCPQCMKPLCELGRRCPSCQADLDLLVDYVRHLNGGLEKAENLTRAGELGQAVWAYLEILEVDPDNAPAKKQVGQVVTAVRQFDLASPGRRLHLGLGNGPGAGDLNILRRWFWTIAAAAAVFVAFSLGYWLGGVPGEPEKGDPNSNPPQHMQPNNTLGPSGK